MRKTLSAAVALAPLCLAASQVPALAASISDSHTTAVATSTANNGAPDDVTITTAGSVHPASGTAVTLDSNNAINNQGLIQFNNVDNATGVLIQGGRTGSLTNSGTITVSTDFTPTDSNSDGVSEAPLSSGTGRYGVRATGAAAFNGAVTTSGSITVSGNNSAAISLEVPITGALSIGGSNSVTGDNSTTVVASGAGGDEVFTGSAVASGLNARAVRLTGDYAGRAAFYGSMSATGFTTLTRPIDSTTLNKIQGTAADLELGGTALSIEGNVAKGLFIGAPPPGTATGSTDDGDGDGIADGSEGAASISSYGTAAAIQIGANGRDVALGAFGTGGNAYGAIIRGTVTGSGLFDGFASTAMQIGVPGGTVHIAGGLYVVRGATVSSTAYQASATAVNIASGSVVPELHNEGAILSTVVSSGASSATAIAINAGAQVNTLTNRGAISASITGDAGSAYGIVDKSGQITTVLNTATIATSIKPVTVGDTLTGKTVALDLSANTSGVKLTQQTDYYGVTPAIVGDVLLGSGTNTVNLLAGSMNGALSLGSSTGSLTIDNGASYAGALTHSGSGAFAINVANGSLTNTSSSAVTLSRLNVGANGILTVTADPANNRATQYQVSGAATLAAGAKIGLQFASTLNTAQSYTIITSPNLSVGSADTTLLTQTPFLFTSSVSTNPTAGTVSVNVQRKTADQLGLRPSEGRALDALYAALPLNGSAEQAVLNASTQADFVGLYRQLLPNYSGGVFLAAQSAAEAVSRATAEREDLETGGAPAMWGQEITYGVNQSAGLGAASHSRGFGFAGGAETGGKGFGAVGFSVAFSTSKTETPDLAGYNEANASGIEGGVYWRGEFGGFRADARAAAGYDTFKSGRQFLQISPTVVDIRNKSNWTGHTLSGRLGLGYEVSAGPVFLRPQVHADYFEMKENAHDERLGAGILDTSIAARDANAVSLTTSLVAGMSFGTDLRWRPQIELGWRDEISGGPPTTTAHFAGGSDFTLLPNEVKGGALTRFALKADTEFVEFTFEAGGQFTGPTKEGDLRGRVRVLF